jgi:hypothetical protein
MAKGVRADRGGDARGLGVAGQDPADAAVAVGLLPARFEQEHRAGPALGVDMQGDGFLERGQDGHDAVFAALAMDDADAAGVEVDVGEPDPDELGDPDAGVEQGLDQDDVAGAAGFPDGVVKRADLGFGGHVRELLRDG